MNKRHAVLKTLIFEDEPIEIPNEIIDLATFRRWANSDQFPENGRICFLNGNLCVDTMPEQVFSHNRVKTEFTRLLHGLAKKTTGDIFLQEGAMLTNEAANLSCEPDGTYVRHDSLELGRVRLVEGEQEDFVELEGTPDMVLEIVSASSVGKDKDALRELYWRAQIPEYWLVDAREERLEFDILRWNSDGYVTTRKQADWVKSRLFGCSFRLTRETNSLGHPSYTLETR